MAEGTRGKGVTGSTLWDRTRQLAAQEILRTALRLFTRQGYDETTIAQIAREAGVSQRTLFRYFGTKEDLVAGSEERFVTLLTETVRDQPADAGTWEVLRAAFEAALRLHATSEEALERFRLVHRTDSLRAAYLGKRVRCQEELLPLLEARPAPPGTDRGHIRAVVATAFACFDAATATWLEGNGQGDVLDLYDQGLAAVRGQALADKRSRPGSRSRPGHAADGWPSGQLSPGAPPGCPGAAGSGGVVTDLASSSRRAQVPSPSQRANRSWTLRHGPKHSGRSRHGAPVCNRPNTPLTTCR